MSFNSFAEFIHMGGYAPYVWSAYGITLVILLANVVQAWQLKRKFLVNEKHVIARENARAENARAEEARAGQVQEET